MNQKDNQKSRSNVSNKSEYEDKGSMNRDQGSSKGGQATHQRESSNYGAEEDQDTNDQGY